MLQSASLPIAYWLPSLAAGVTTSVLAIIVWMRRPSQPATTLGLYLMSVAIWSFGYCLQLRGTTLEQQLFWSKVEYLGPIGVSMTGLIFTLQYSGLSEWVRTSRLLLLTIIPAVTEVLVWTSNRHGLIWSRIWLDTSGPYPLFGRAHGPWFWVFLVYGYALSLISMFLLFRVLYNRPGIYRSQTVVLLLGCITPFIGNVLYSFNLPPHSNLDLTVFAFSITGISMAWGLFRFQLPVIMPIARQTVFEGMSDGVVALDTSGNVVEVNPEASAIFGQPASRLIGRPIDTLFDLYPELAALHGLPREQNLELTIKRGGARRRYEVKCSFLKTRKERVIGSLIVLHDVSERELAEAELRQAHAVLEQRIDERTSDLSRTIAELREAENLLTHRACHDSLTGLANRKLFLDRVAERVECAGADDGPSYAVLYVDIDRFKIYNDGYGHHVGDRILVEMSRRLQNCLQPADTVARIGGDEFTILVNSVEGVAEASRLALACLEALALPARVAEHDIHLTASIGIALGLSRYRSAEEIVRDADLAMYRAKRMGGNRTLFFGESMRSSALALLQLERDLRLAVVREELVVQYQPFVRMQTGGVVGFEALVRWRHPERGMLQPADFLPVAEQSGMLVAIDEFVLREACRQKALWALASNSAAEIPFVSVNVSGWQFSHPRRWWEALSRLQGQAGGLRLEMLESVLVANAHAAVEFFAQVRTHDLHISLDDFGTGYSSLSWLSHFPIRSLKIDRSFVEGIATGGRDVSIIRAIIALARSLDMEVVAEGIESEQQSEILLELGCEYGQGFHFSPPVDAGAALAMVV
jgi:diguanylate cyclase (GGDEF)-like protein/PAS domain S-box-containing protein